MRASPRRHPAESQLPFLLEGHQTVMQWNAMRRGWIETWPAGLSPFLLRVPVEPQPPPIREPPDPPENPDVPMQDPQPEDLPQI